MKNEQPHIIIEKGDRTLRKCPVDIFSEGASWRIGLIRI